MSNGQWLYIRVISFLWFCFFLILTDLHNLMAFRWILEKMFINKNTKRNVDLTKRFSQFSVKSKKKQRLGFCWYKINNFCGKY